ncbi:hypothetical protein ACFL0I_00575 [Gemmatimonadota bacterium]
MRRSERTYLFLVRWLRLRFSPEILPRLVRSDLGSEEKSALFSFVQAFLSGGHTYKETARRRTRIADAEVLVLCDGLDSPVVLEVGASDGASSLVLKEALDGSATLILTDRYPGYSRRGVPGFRLYLDVDRFWISVKILGIFYLFLGSNLRFRKSGSPISTENPALEEHGIGLRKEPFDMFHDVRTPPVDVIKCSNLLHHDYFSPGEVREALWNLGASLRDGGHLVISQNHPKYEGGEAVSVFRRQARQLSFLRQSNSPDILPPLLDGGPVLLG